MIDYYDIFKASGLLVSGWILGLGVLYFWSIIKKIWNVIKK